MEMHSVANLATLQTPLVTFSLQKSAQTLFRFWESPVLPHEREVLLSTRVHRHISLSLFLCVSSVQRAAAEEQHFQLNTDII